MADSFWEVQKIWSRAKNSAIVLGPKAVTRVAASNARVPAQAPSSGEDVAEKLLMLLASRGSFDSYELAQELGLDHQQVVGAIKSVQSVGEVRH